MDLDSAVTRPAHDRILDAASRLFYRDGFRAVGVDRIIAESGVSKLTLYRHFPSKDALIVAYLERSNQQFWTWLNRETIGVRDPKAKLLAIFKAVGKLAGSPECLGCTFQGTAAEFPDVEHPGHRIALAHKRVVVDLLASLARKARLRNPHGLAEELLLLMDGAWVAARMFGRKNPATHVADAARILVDAHR